MFIVENDYNKIEVSFMRSLYFYGSVFETESNGLEEAKKAVSQGDWTDAFTSFFPILLKAALIFFIGILVTHYITKFLIKIMNRSTIDQRFHTVILQVVKTLFYIVIVYAALNTLIGSSALTNAMVTIMGTVGLAFSLAVKDDLSNYISGLLILGSNQFSIGDHIKVGEQEGKVADIRMNYTLLNSDDNRQIFIPNSIMAKSVVINSTGESTRSILLTYTIANVSDLSRAKEIMQKLVKENKKILDEPEPFVGVSSVASVVKLEVRAWVKTEDLYTVKFSLNENIPEAFEKEGIPIA